MVVLETERLLLRRWRPEDREPFAAINADAAVTRHLGGTPLTRDESDTLVDRIDAHWDEWGYGLCAVEPKATGAMVGFIGLGHHRALPMDVEIGWRLASDVWGEGLATEGATAARDWAFGPLAIDRLVSITIPENVASWRVMEKLGMTLWRHLSWEDLNLKIYELEATQGS